MIIKVKTFKRPDFRKLLEYIIQKEDRLINKDAGGFLLTHNLRGRTIEGWERQFIENEKHRLVKRKDSVYISHEIISWHKADAKHITGEILQEITREYITRRNTKAMYVAVPHYDKEHYHIHIMASGIEYKTGKSSRISKKDFATLKKDIQTYQLERFPELSQSTVKHGRKQQARETEKEYQLKKRSGKETNKKQITDILNDCYAKATSKTDFYAKVHQHGLTTYIRGGRVYGIAMNDIKYRFKGLGFEQSKIDALDIQADRGNTLNDLRAKEKERRIKRER